MALKIITSPSGARFTVNAEHADRFQRLVNGLEEAGYPIKGDQSGGYNYRNIAGTNRLSNHAHGAAIDVNWSENARGRPGQIPEDLARRLAAENGLTWGGDWKNRDDMHFEVAGGHSPNDGHNHGPRTAVASAAPTPPGEQPMLPMLASLFGMTLPAAGTAAAGTAAAGTAAAGTAGTAGAGAAGTAGAGASGGLPLGGGFSLGGLPNNQDPRPKNLAPDPMGGMGQQQPDAMPDMSRLMAVLQQRRRFG